MSQPFQFQDNGRVVELAFTDLDAALAVGVEDDKGTRNAIAYQADGRLRGGVKQARDGTRSWWRFGEERHVLEIPPADWWKVAVEPGCLPAQGSRYAPRGVAGRWECSQCHMQIASAAAAHGDDGECFQAVAWAVSDLVEWRNR